MFHKIYDTHTSLFHLSCAYPVAEILIDLDQFPISFAKTIQDYDHQNLRSLILPTASFEFLALLNLKRNIRIQKFLPKFELLILSSYVYQCYALARSMHQKYHPKLASSFYSAYQALHFCIMKLCQ